MSSAVASANAQGVTTPTPAPTDVPPPLQQGVVLVPDENAVSFQQLYGAEITLNGPYDSTTNVFGLPADWKLNGDARLELNLTVSSNLLTVGSVSGNADFNAGGILTVLVNRNVVATIPLVQNGEIQQSVIVPESALVSLRPDGRMELSFTFDSGLSCDINQQMIVYIHQSSIMVLPHEIVLPDTTLARFPYPLYQDSIFPDAALVVIPDQPSAGELQAAFTVAAGLANLTSSALALDMATVSQVTPEQLSASSIILVGRAESLPLLAELQLPLPVDSQGFGLSNADDGVAQMTISSWNPSHVVFVVSGNTDLGVEKAAQATTTGVFRANSAPNLAIVQAIEPEQIPTTIPVNQSLSDLGYDSRTFSQNTGSLTSSSANGTSTTFSYKFYIPAGQVPTSEAYFELAFGHSSLINYSRSGAIISINGQPIHSIRLSDEFANNAVNKIKTSIPPATILNGYNRLDVQVTLFPPDVCTVQSLRGLWFTIWPESNLYLPLTPALVSLSNAVDLGSYPAPYVLNSTLSSTALVVQKDSIETWQSAFKIAYYLGDRANGAITTLKAFYGDNIPENERAGSDFLIIGQPSKMPILTEINEKLPAPFENDTAKESNLQVTYRIKPDAPQGYVQLLPSPWNENNVIIATAGNTMQGTLWAANALIDTTLRNKLAGNFAAVTDTQVVTADTRVNVLSVSLPANSDGSTVTASEQTVVLPTNLDLNPPPTQRPGWIMQVILASVALTLFILLAGLFTSWYRNRKK
jgi:hypothetical protein